MHAIIDVLQEKDELQRKELEELQDKLERIEKEKGEAKTSMKNQLDDITYERDHLKKEKDDIQKVLQALHKNFKIQQQKHKQELKKKQAKIDKLSSEVKSLKEEISSRQEASEKVHENMVVMKSKNDHLSKENDSLKNEVAVYKKNDEKKREQLTMTDRLRKELEAGVQDLQAVMRLMLQTMDGTGAVNLADLLNTDLYDEQSVANDDATCDKISKVIAHADMLSITGKQMTDVRSVRKDLVNVRKMISDRYAENIGNTCISQ